MKNRLLSFLMSVILLATAAIPVSAAGPDAAGDEWGGLAPPSGSGEAEAPAGTEKAPSAPADEWGGLAPPVSPEDESPQSPDGPEAGETPAGVSLVSGRHIAYALGDGKPLPSFNPGRQVTRSEVAVMLYRLLPQDTVLPAAAYSDIPASSWCYEAASALGGLNVMRGGEETFQPDDKITRSEFVRCLASFFPLREDARQFPDVPEDSPDAPFIRSARAYGWTQGNTDGLFHPEDGITRAEVAVMVNRALGRRADQEYISRTHPAFYVDVSPEKWFYYDVMEASVYHEHTGENTAERWTSHTLKQNAPSDGFHLQDGWLYCYSSATGDVLRNTSYQGHDFDANGHFTSGSAELDGKLRNIVLAKTNSSMTQEQMLRALYVYNRDSFAYLRRPAYEFGATGFMMEDALRLLNTGYGNCYCYASLFWYLSRWIGYDSRIYSGTVGQNRSPHSWVEITMEDGLSYIFDAELEMAYRRKKRYDVNLYKFRDAKNSWRYVRP